jgi:hypothetical protein
MKNTLLLTLVPVLIVTWGVRTGRPKQDHHDGDHDRAGQHKGVPRWFGRELHCQPGRHDPIFQNYHQRREPEASSGSRRRAHGEKSECSRFRRHGQYPGRHSAHNDFGPLRHSRR